MTSCDVFCRVIDNFGDAGFGWRLAHTLQVDHHLSVRLIIDCPEIVKRLSAGKHDGVEVVLWDKTFEAVENPTPADAVIEAFSCHLPDNYEAAIAKAFEHRRIDVFAIEYLTAESFAEKNNGLPSPHPRYGYPKTYIYPGFTQKTAGLILENDYEKRRRAFTSEDRKQLLMGLGADPGHPFTFLFFTYPDFDTKAFLEALKNDGRPIQLLCAPGQATDNLLNALEKEPIPCVQTCRMPFLDQSTFDQVLWSVNAALVRGEESPIRAQLAGIPFLWTLYRIKHGEHLEKAKAFAKLYAPLLPHDTDRIPWKSLFLSMNDKAVKFSKWKAWRNSIEENPDLGEMWRMYLNISNSLTDFLCKRMGKG